MNAKQDPANLLASLTLEQLIEATAELVQDALDVASVSRTLKLRTLEGLYSGPLVRDLLLSWASQAMAVRAQLRFWTEMNEYASGLLVSQIGTSYTHGSVLAMELIEYTLLVSHYTDLLKIHVDAVMLSN